MKYMVLASFGVFTATLTSIFGVWSESMTTLCVFMVIDYILGLMLSYIFKKSPKTETGGLNSRIHFKGIVKKISMVILVIVGARADMLLGTNFIQYGIVYSFILNELISITENIGLMGVPLPSAITKAIDLLNSNIKGGKDNEL